MPYEYDFNGNRYRSAYGYNGMKLGKSTPAELNSVGEEVLANAKQRIAKFAEPNALLIGFVTDIHRSTGIYHIWTINDTGTLHLLSRLADEIDLDCVFVGGDLVNGRKADGETNETIRGNQQAVVDELDELLPYTNIYSTIGNHDKRYASDNELLSNKYFHDLFDTVQYKGNGVELTYIDDTNYYVDFPKQKIRIIVANQYDATTASQTASATHCTWAWTSGLNFVAPKQASEWLVGVVFHGMVFTGIKDILEAYKDGTSAEHYANTNGEAGKGYLGSFVGHSHHYSINDEGLANGKNSVWTTSAYATEEQMGTADEYGLAVFVINPSGLHHQIRIGRDKSEVPFATIGHIQDGLLENGTFASSGNIFCVYDGNHVRFDRRINIYLNGINLTNLAMNRTSYIANNHVADDTENVLLSLSAGDVIKTEIIFSDACDTTNRNFSIFSPQILGMVTGKVVSGQTYAKEITLTEDTDVTAIGMYYGGGSSDGIGIMDFELNVYVNGQRITERT